ncbi:MAG: ADP-ribosylglycohydrolase family protein [Schaedlerella sp.]|nr:ADP-ribosylglycohydrolase family protein [Schaedlerella sp.]
MTIKHNIYLDGIMGVVVGDALGVPVEFSSRGELKEDPVIGMRAYGTFNLPAGSWSDDSSMTLATLDSLKSGYDPKDMMDKFAAWMDDGVYTPFGELFDIGCATSRAITRYLHTGNIRNCGGKTDRDNGNGSLMRIMPICLYCYEEFKKGNISKYDVIQMIHEVSGLTHNHMRSKIACGLYYFMAKAILEEKGNLKEKLQKGLDEGLDLYSEETDVIYYYRMKNLDMFKNTEEDGIRSSGYVVDSLEAAVWCLINTDTYEAAMLKAVNLGSDTDTVAAIAGGLAGLYYGYAGIPDEWLNVIKRIDWIEELCGVE